jgi:hypothetical protein
MFIFQISTGNPEGWIWRRGSESNRRIKVLQTLALPLGYRAPVFAAICKIARRRVRSQIALQGKDSSRGGGPRDVHRARMMQF